MTRTKVKLRSHNDVVHLQPPMERSKVKSRSNYDVAHLYSLTNVPTVRCPRFSPNNILQVKVTNASSKVKSRSHHDVAHLHSLTNVPTKYQLPSPYGFREKAQARFSNSKSLQQGQRSNQGHTITLHTYTPNQSPYQVSYSYPLPFLRYRPDKLFLPPASLPIRSPWVKTTA